MTALIQLSQVEIGEEVAWIEKAKANPVNFEPLYNRYFNPVFRFVYQRMDSKDTTADVVSQVFLKALMNISKFQPRGLPFFAWLCRIAISEIANYYNRSRKFRVINIEAAGITEMAGSFEMEISEELQQAIIEAIQKLDENDTLLIEMRYFEGRPFKEIGEILNITENNAKVKLYRVLDKVKKLVSHENSMS